MTSGTYRYEIPHQRNYNGALSSLPTYGNNPWIDGVSYNGKLVNNQTTPEASLNGGSAVLVNIAFPSYPALPLESIKAAEELVTGIIPWSDNLVSSYLDAFSEWSKVANIKFSLSDPASADIHYYRATYSTNDYAGAHQGILDPPQGFPQISVVNGNLYHENSPTGRGADFLTTAIHEIGHGIGLKHPHDTGLGSPMGVFPGLVHGDANARAGYGLYGINQGIYTMMSYNFNSNRNADGSFLSPRPTNFGGNVSTPMALDIMASQIKYGYNPLTASGDDIYRLPTAGPQESTYWQTIYDTNGSDVIDASEATGDVFINLQAARMNAFRFQEQEMSESYNFINPTYAPLYQRCVQTLAPEGGLLGSAALFALTVEDVVDDLEITRGAGWLGNFYSSKLGEAQGNIWQAARSVIEEISVARNRFALKDVNFARKLTDAIKYQEDLLSESAAHVGGYMSQQIGTLGGLFIAAGTTIENALGSLFNDSITGNYTGNTLEGLRGDDIIDGRAGDDLIRGGNGADVLIGGLGGDELHGDFGRNTYKSEKDGFSDLIAIKSDQYLVNWIYGKAGNNSDGAKCDIIEGLDAVDKIKIIGVDTRDITFAANVTTEGLTGIGIYGKGALEALYTGGDLTINQITQMTSGDASAAAMANQVSSYGVW
jgi:hypothetical protein